jgi:hypothetical protein
MNHHRASSSYAGVKLTELIGNCKGIVEYISEYFVNGAGIDCPLRLKLYLCAALVAGLKPCPTVLAAASEGQRLPMRPVR